MRFHTSVRVTGSPLADVVCSSMVSRSPVFAGPDAPGKAAPGDRREARKGSRGTAHRLAAQREGELRSDATRAGL
jgi:hypothetical protein